MKKGVIEIQFNWIFILIVGAIILAFFVGIVMTQNKISNEGTAVKLAYDLETIATGAEVSRGTAQTIRIPDIGIDFSAVDCNRRYSIGGGSKDYREKIIFAPSRIEGSDLIAWTVDWSFPFRITNFLLLTAKDMRYIIVYPALDSNAKQFASMLNRSMPDSINKDMMDDGAVFVNVKNYDNYKVRIIYVGIDPTTLIPNSIAKLQDKQVSALHIKDYPMLYTKGTIDFYRKKVLGFVKAQSSYGFGMTSLYGAIFTDDPDVYDCNMQEAFRKMYHMANLLQNRTHVLYSSASSASCQNQYMDGLVQLAVIQNNATELIAVFPGGDSGTLTDDIKKSAYDEVVGLQRINGNLQLQSCPEMY